MDAIPQRVETSGRRPLGRQVQLDLEFSNLVVGVVGPRGHAPVLPSPSNTDEAGPLPSPEVVLSFGLQAVLRAPRHPAGRTRLRGNTAYTRPSLAGQTTAGPGTARASPVPAPTIRPCRSLYPGGFLTAAPPGSSRRPWPSPRFPRLGSPLSHSRGRRQDSHHVTAQAVAPPEGVFDAGLRRRASPQRRQPATRRPGAYRGRTSTGRRMRAYVQIRSRPGTTSKHWAHGTSG